MHVSLEDKLVSFCEKARAKGFTIKQGLWRNKQKKECCALGALCLLSGTTDTKRSTPRRAMKLLGVGESWVRSFAAGFDESMPDYPGYKGHRVDFDMDHAAYQTGVRVAKRVNPIHDRVFA